jgi:hypothetical protein
MRAVLLALSLVFIAPASSSVRLDVTPTPVLAGAHVGTLKQAVRLFGKPDRLAYLPGTRPLCSALWRRVGVEIRFSTDVGCSASGAWWQVRLRAARWHTKLGLHVGDSGAKLRALYPHAARLDFLGLGSALWELETGGPLCDGGPPLALAARLATGRVDSLFAVHVPACG